MSLMRYILLFCLIYIYISNAVLNYGPFKVRIAKLDYCKGPKQKDCGVVKMFQRKVNDSAFEATSAVVKNIDTAKFRLIGSVNRKTILRFQLDSICKNVGVEMMMRTLVSMSENCTILQGSYRNIFNIDYWANFIFGGKYFYGNFTFKAASYNQHCNYACAVYDIEISPRII